MTNTLRKLAAAAVTVLLAVTLVMGSTLSWSYEDELPNEFSSHASSSCPDPSSDTTTSDTSVSSVSSATLTCPTSPTSVSSVSITCPTSVTSVSSVTSDSSLTCITILPSSTDCDTSSAASSSGSSASSVSSDSSASSGSVSSVSSTSSSSVSSSSVSNPLFDTTNNPNIPKTGDITALGLWFLALAVCAVLLRILLFSNWAKRTRKEGDLV